MCECARGLASLLSLPPDALFQCKSGQLDGGGQVGTSHHSDHWLHGYCECLTMLAFCSIQEGLISREQVISYVVIAALADAFPAGTHFNRSAGIVQVIGIYVIEMVCSTVTHQTVQCLLQTHEGCWLTASAGLLGLSRPVRLDLRFRDLSQRPA